MVPIGVESNCSLCEVRTEAEETYFITEAEFSLCEMWPEAEERVELPAYNTVLNNHRAAFQQKKLMLSLLNKF